MRVKKAFALALAALIAFFSFGVPALALEGNALEGNALEGNALSGNALSGNALSGNALSGNALSGVAVEAGASGSFSGFYDISSGLQESSSAKALTGYSFGSSPINDLSYAAPSSRALTSWYGDRLTGETRVFYNWLVKAFKKYNAQSGIPSSVAVVNQTVNLTHDKCMAALHAVLWDHPELTYWVNKGSGTDIYTFIFQDSPGEPQTVILVMPVFDSYRGEYRPLQAPVNLPDGSVGYKDYPAWEVMPGRGGADKKALQMAEALVSNAASLKGDYQKIKYFYEQLCKLTEYNYEAVEQFSGYGGAFQMFDAFLGRPVVCEGYSKAFKYLCDRAGIPCLIITGQASTSPLSGGAHMWNYVMLGGKWYHVDVTMGDGNKTSSLLAVGSDSVALKRVQYVLDGIANESGGRDPLDLQLSKTAYNPAAPVDGGASSGGGTSVGAQSPGKQLAALAKEAVHEGKKNIVVRNAETLSPEDMQLIASSAKAAGGSVRLLADTLSGKSVAVRMYIDPAVGAKLSKPIRVTGEINNQSLMNLFAKEFTNTLSTITFAQKSAFGMEIPVSAKLDLMGMDTGALRFYSYNSATGACTRLTGMKYSIDKSGYLKFTVSQGGTIIVTDGPLTSR